MPPPELPLLVLALGGNALNPPAGDQGYAAERRAAAAAAQHLAAFAQRGYRLLVVHGNGPQVGRLMGAGEEPGNLDIHVAQTQGELGYLLAEALQAASGDATVALVTRALVDPDDPAFAQPTKPIGPLLKARPESGPAVQLAGGWRRTVASPRPQAVVEERAIATLLREHHVIAGGGGGIALARTPVDLHRQPGGLPGVIDKDRVAAHLAIALKAQALLFATDVAGVEDAHGTSQAHLHARLTASQAQDLLSAGVLGAGSMAPKVESALAYARATGRPARILHADALARALDDPAPGTLIEA